MSELTKFQTWMAGRLLPKTKEEVYSLLMEYTKQMAEQKNNDYSPENIRIFGEVGVCVRMGDKAMRLKSLVVEKRKQRVSNESIQDSYFDIANYGFIAVMLQMGWWDLPWSSELPPDETSF